MLNFKLFYNFIILRFENCFEDLDSGAKARGGGAGGVIVRNLGPSYPPASRGDQEPKGHRHPFVTKHAEIPSKRAPGSADWCQK